MDADETLSVGRNEKMGRTSDGAAGTAEDREIDAFVTAARRVAGHGLTRCSSGNLSVRLGRDRMLITASGSWMAELTPADVLECRLVDGMPVQSEKRPSVELGFHRRILARRTDMNVVLHFQSPAATTLACMDIPLPDFAILLKFLIISARWLLCPILTPGRRTWPWQWQPPWRITTWLF